MKSARALIVLAALVMLAGCGAVAAAGAPTLVPGLHDALRTHGVQAEGVGELWNVFLAVCTAVFIAVLAAIAAALSRAGRAQAATPADLSSPGRRERAAHRAVIAGVAVSTVLLLALLVASVWTDRVLARMPLADALHLEVTGHQWWWEAQYKGNPESDTFITANELHVPVGRPVLITLRSDDVIHSLWMPSLAGKKDLVPGRTALMHFRADHAGIYRGQCAEFCGMQHAYMALEIVADPPDRFAEWLATQRKPAVEATGGLRRGEQVFLGSTCVMCHAIQGTSAGARKAPDLTHVGGRTTLAAGRLANNTENLKRWIADPQSIKPGAAMPPSTLSGADLDALVAYLESLK